MMNRRDWITGLGASWAAASTVSFAPAATVNAVDQARRMQWWHEARFGMFVHWGLYSVLGRHEWAMEQEGITGTRFVEV